MAPDGGIDRVTIHRLARCDGRTGAVLLHLPGGNMNGDLPEVVPEADLRALLARDGFVVWTLDYRSHSIPADATPARLAALGGWTAERFADDAAAALDEVRSVERTTPWISGFSYGAGLAYRLAARGETIAGLIVLDGAPPDGRPAPAGDSPAIDLAGGRLGWPDRERLLDAVMRDPEGPSPLSGFATAGNALVSVVHGARAFGGAGGLSAVKDGATDVRVLAGLLATYDRWWPRAALGGGAVTAVRRLPVIAFATERMGDAWGRRVRDGAIAFAGDAAVVHDLRGYGHVDVLVGKEVATRVVPPIRDFVRAHDAGAR